MESLPTPGLDCEFLEERDCVFSLQANVLDGARQQLELLPEVDASISAGVHCARDLLTPPPLCSDFFQ